MAIICPVKQAHFQWLNNITSTLFLKVTLLTYSSQNDGITIKYSHAFILGGCGVNMVILGLY